MKRILEGKIEVNLSKKPKHTGSEEKEVIETSSESPEDTILNSSSRESEEDDKTIVIDSSESRLNNLEIAKNSSDIREVKTNSIDNKQHFLEETIKGYMSILQEGVSDKTTCDHVIASILDIYTESRSYTEVLNQIVEDVEGIQENHRTFESLCALASSIAGYNRDISDIYGSKDTQAKEELEDMIAGRTYDTICDIYCLE